MRTHLFACGIAAAGAAALVAACVHNPPAVSGPASTRPPADACQRADTEADTCIDKGNKRTCVVYVGEVGGKPYVFPYKLRVPPDDQGNRKAVIVWRLQQSMSDNFEFEKAKEDGPEEFIAGKHGQFEEDGPTDDPDGGHQNKAKAVNFRIKFKNTANMDEKYTIRYRKNGAEVRCDPRIISQGG